ncbi:MAG: histidinol-phosphate transaminase [Spirochaetota bacterium]|jgi:histidinol-phosphate aminotransferase|nr:histidinol-phosphate transaminase [Spirochaetota bacterium]
MKEEIARETRFWNVRLRSMHAYQPGEQPKFSPQTLKLNTNENPYPPSPKAIRAMRQAIGADLRLYPPADWQSLRQAIGEEYDVSPAQVFCGNGSDEVLSLIFRSFMNEGDLLVLAYPTYSLYPVLAEANGCRTAWVDTREDFSIDPDAMLAEARTGEARMAIIANPNAPTGMLLDKKQIREFAERFNGLVVVDEAYIDFAGEGASCFSELGALDNLIILRTFSKSFSLCGIRVGYAFAAPILVEGLMAMKDSYNIDRAAQIGAEAAIRDIAWMRKNAARICKTRAKFTQALCARGFETLPSAGNFVFTRHPKISAAELQSRLQQEEIYVRHFEARRVSEYLRISIGTDKDMTRLTGALDRALNGSAPEHSRGRA